MRITILGGGNMGSVLAVRFSQQHDVSLYVNSNRLGAEYHKDMKVFSDNDVVLTGKISEITFDLAKAVSGAEWIFITFPAFMFEDIAARLIPLLTTGQHLVFVPGSGGAEFWFKPALEKGCTITGLQRVHSVARIIDRGESVRESGIRPVLRIASIPQSFNEEARKTLSDLYDMPVESLGSYLNVTLVNSNPILHTARLYSLFKDYKPGITEYDRIPLFYEEWSDESSHQLIAMDNELFALIDVLNKKGCGVHAIIPLLDHYESFDAECLTRKIRSIKSLQGLATPSVITEKGKCIPNLDSRYFTADFPFGLAILIAVANIAGVACPNMVTVFGFYQALSPEAHDFDLSRFGMSDLNDFIHFYR